MSSSSPAQSGISSSRLTGFSVSPGLQQRPYAGLASLLKIVDKRFALPSEIGITHHRDCGQRLDSRTTKRSSFKALQPCQIYPPNESEARALHLPLTSRVRFLTLPSAY
jgi:hypothetical protein